MPTKQSLTSVVFKTAFAPKPKKSDVGEMSLKALLTDYSKLRYTLGLSWLIECRHFASSKVRLAIEKSMPVRGTISTIWSAIRLRKDVRLLH